MRKNLFLHFMNRDTREIMRVYDLLGRERHSQALRRPFNASAMLCEEFCISPPGFVVEDDISFELYEIQHPYLEEGLFRLPIRDRNLADFAEKKRGEYAPARNRYSGLFDDSRMSFLSSFGTAIIQRQVKIGPAIIEGFRSGVDTKLNAWKGIRAHATPQSIQEMRDVPARLAEDGKALTWSMIRPELSEESAPLHKQMRDALQHTYFKEYCREFGLITMSDIPYLNETFYLPTDRTVYSFRRLVAFLSGVHAVEMFLDGSAAFITRMRMSSGFQEFMDAYVELAAIFKDDTNLRYHMSRAVASVKFDWAGLAVRRKGLLDDPSAFEILEIADACTELASALVQEHGLKTRASTKKADLMLVKPLAGGRDRLIVTIFVALEEELDVLVNALDLSTHADQPIARGSISDVDIHVICPRSMGRVPAAVAITHYLATSKQLPGVILCVGLAGGFKEAGIDPGCVICAETVVDLANRKITDDGDNSAHTKFRRRDFDCTRSIYNLLRSGEFDAAGWESHCRKHFSWPAGRVPSLREGKIASVDEVISSDEQRKKMVNSEDKLLGVEMEAGGVCAAAKSFRVPVAVLRVVSDMADPSKADDKWRALGMQTLAELIKRMPLARAIEMAHR